MTFVGTVAEGLVLGKSATANGNDLASAEVVFVTIAVYDLEITFYFERTVVVDCNFCSCHIVGLGRENKGKRFRTALCLLLKQSHAEPRRTQRNTDLNREMRIKKWVTRIYLNDLAASGGQMGTQAVQARAGIASGEGGIKGMVTVK